MTFGHPVPHPHFLFQTLLSQLCDFPFVLFFFTSCSPKPKPKLTHFFSVWLLAFPLTGAVIRSPREQHLNTMFGVYAKISVSVNCVFLHFPMTNPGSQTRGATVVALPSLVVVVGTFQFDFWFLPFAFSRQITLLFSFSRYYSTGTGCRVVDTGNGFYCTYCSISISCCHE